MSTVYKLPYTGNEIKEKIGQVDKNTTAIGRLSEQIADEVSARENAIVDLKAQGVQQVPLFANSIEECTDTTKVYVLPDGYIYGYMKGTGTCQGSEELDITWTDNARLSSSNGVYKYDVTGYTASEHIDLSVLKNIGETLAITGITFVSTNSSRAVAEYENGTFVTTYYPNTNTSHPIGDSGVTLNVMNSNGSIIFERVAKSTDGNSHEIALCGYGLGANAVVTRTGEVTLDGVMTWTNTGRAFVPADYEDRIVELETENNQLKNDLANAEQRIENLENVDSSYGVVDYVVEEAERVAKEVLAVQNANTFTTIHIADMHEHLSNEQIMISNLHACQGMKLIRNKIHIDHTFVQGDNGWGSGIVGSDVRATIELGTNEIHSANGKLNEGLGTKDTTRVRGNHDLLMCNYSFNNNEYMNDDKLFPLYDAYNKGAVFDSENKDRGYCYRDFEYNKIRVIALNTSDVKGLTPADDTTANYISGNQLKWLASAIDLSDKEDSAEWQILIVSHHPLDWTNSIYAVNILKAYVDGSTVSMTRDGISISYNYSGKNSATIIGNAHGHTHGFKVDYLRYLDSSSNVQTTTIKRFAIPNACFERTNEYGENETTESRGIEFGEETTYDKVANSAQDTSFVVAVYDTKAKKAHLFCYGAGYDRVVTY